MFCVTAATALTKADVSLSLKQLERQDKRIVREGTQRQLPFFCSCSLPKDDALPFPVATQKQARTYRNQV